MANTAYTTCKRPQRTFASPSMPNILHDDPIGDRAGLGLQPGETW